jgi:hypothetical protein
MPADTLAILAVLFLVVGALYASVGHAGASGYLAVMALVGSSPPHAPDGALDQRPGGHHRVYVQFARAGHFSWALFWPFAAASIPAAFVGGLIHLPAARAQGRHRRRACAHGRPHGVRRLATIQGGAPAVPLRFPWRWPSARRLGLVCGADGHRRGHLPEPRDSAVGLGRPQAHSRDVLALYPCSTRSRALAAWRAGDGRHRARCGYWRRALEPEASRGRHSAAGRRRLAPSMSCLRSSCSSRERSWWSHESPLLSTPAFSRSARPA